MEKLKTLPPCPAGRRKAHLTRLTRGLALGFTLVELMIVVAIIGVLSSVAIPSFMKYIRRSKTTEATMNIRKLFDGSVSYFETEHGSMAGNILARQFPAAVIIPVPALGTCCASTGQKCTPKPSLWSAATWQALNFSMDEPHYYSYSFNSSGTETTSVFDATANGDLNCDKIYSTFSRHGSVDSTGNVVGGSGIFTKNDIE